MNIVVTLKQVADPNIPPGDIKLDVGAKRIVSPFGVAPVMNGYDANALEEALRLREKHGGRVTAIGLGDDGSRDALKRAIAMGADTAVLLNDPDWLHADSAGVGRALAAAVRKIGNIDLVLCGRQASDTDGGQVLYWLAAALGLPSVSPVAKIEEVDGRILTVHRLSEEGYHRLRVEMPALIGISSEINEPRLPSLRGITAAGRAHIPGWKASHLGLPPSEQPSAHKVELRQLRVQLRTTQAELISGDSGAAQGAALADKLHQLGLL
jgi:electron transfer flavoprotein beta subunit